ncbi:MAG TPA: glycosyl hydrolase [Polyangiaceae bacterium]|nr:glycosyl hydrolase [Polyangiaceae bacterium]
MAATARVCCLAAIFSVACGGNSGAPAQQSCPAASSCGGTSHNASSNAGTSIIDSNNAGQGGGSPSGVAGQTTGGSPSGMAGSGGIAENGGVSGIGGDNTSGNGGASVQGGAGGSPGEAGTNNGGAAQGGSTGINPPPGFVLSPYKDTSINFDWNNDIVSTLVPGTRTPLVMDLPSNGGKAVTLAFATGECGAENWGGVMGEAMAMANVAAYNAAGVDYALATGGAAGSFTCGSDAGMQSFIERWASPHLRGIDYDIEAGQTPEVIHALIERIPAAHAAHSDLRFSLTLATLANNAGAEKAQSLGAGVAESLNQYGVTTLQAVADVIGDWPSYLTVNLMTMDYGAPGMGVCVVKAGACEMGESALQAAYNLHDKWGVPFANIELTPMIGGNDVQGEHFTLNDVDTVMTFALTQGLAGVHYWSYDRDTDCIQDFASPTCNSLGNVGNHGFLTRFLAAMGN